MSQTRAWLILHPSAFVLPLSSFRLHPSANLLVDIAHSTDTMTHDMGVSRDSEFRGKNREDGANPSRSRRCNRGRKPQLTTATRLLSSRGGHRYGKVRSVA